MFGEEPEAACYHRKHPVVSIALVDDLALLIARVGNFVDCTAKVDRIVKLAEVPLDVLFPAKVLNRDGALFRQTMSFRKDDHHPLLEKRDVVQPRIWLPVRPAIYGSFDLKIEQLFFKQPGFSIDQLHLNFWMFRTETTQHWD